MENPTPGPWHLSAEGAITATAPEGGERLIATVHHPADALRQQVDDLALALIAPLGAQNHN